MEKGKQLTLSQRNRIEEMLNQRRRKFEIANELDKTQSTIAREINRHKILKPHNIYKSSNLFNCKFFVNCKVCTNKCRIFQPISCKDRDRNIGVCNNCSKLKTCNLDKYFYFAEEAHKKYKYTLTDSKQGVNLNTSKLIELAHLICLLIKKGQSIYTILQNHKEITQCKKTIYTYIEMGLFKDWGITNVDLRRKVRRKITGKNKIKKRSESADYTGRKYDDYVEFVKNNPTYATTEMDTVYNYQKGPYIQTFIFENTGFMIGRLRQHRTSEEMSESLNYFQELLEDEMYKKLFGLLLTDRGSEFAKQSELFEVNTETGEIRSNIFYCDAQMPSQKPHVENNHEFIRDIILKKKDMSVLTQDKLDLMFSHINSVPRKSLGGKAPYEALEFFYGKEPLEKFNIQKIKEDEVTLQSYLLQL